MNRREYLSLMTSFGACALAASSPIAQGSVLNAIRSKSDESKLRLRILSYNIQIGREPGGSYSDPSQAHLDHTSKVVKDAEPDVVGLQEVDNMTERSGADVDQLGTIAHLTSMIPTFCPKTPLPGGMYGVGVLSHERPLSFKSVIMEGSAHPRALQMMEFERYYFFNTHLPLKADLRLKAVQTIEREGANRLDKPIVLVGDLNAEPTSEEIQYLCKTWTKVSPDAPTFPAPAPKVEIDYVFVRNAKKINVIESRVIEDPRTSDHRPVFCEIEIE